MLCIPHHDQSSAAHDKQLLQKNYCVRLRKSNVALKKTLNQYTQSVISQKMPQ
jgi:hypothetical protein